MTGRTKGVAEYSRRIWDHLEHREVFGNIVRQVVGLESRAALHLRPMMLIIRRRLAGARR